MRLKNYEKKNIIIFLFIIIFILEIMFIFLLFNIKNYKYVKISGIVIKKNILMVVVGEDERKLIYNNHYLFYKDSKKKYKIIEDRGVLLKNDDVDYYEILINFKFVGKENDALTLVLKNRKYRLIEMFKVIWEGV